MTALGIQIFHHLIYINICIFFFILSYIWKKNNNFIFFHNCVETIAWNLATSASAWLSNLKKYALCRNFLWFQPDYFRAVKVVCVCVCTSAERGTVLSVVLDLCVLPHQQTSELPHLPLQQVAHGQQGAHQLSAHLKTRRTHSERGNCGPHWSHLLCDHSDLYDQIFHFLDYLDFTLFFIFVFS